MKVRLHVFMMPWNKMDRWVDTGVSHLFLSSRLVQKRFYLISFAEDCL